MLNLFHTISIWDWFFAILFFTSLPVAVMFLIMFCFPTRFQKLFVTPKGVKKSLVKADAAERAKAGAATPLYRSMQRGEASQ